MSEYKLFAIPLDGTDPVAAPSQFAIQIVSSLEFPPGTISVSSINDAVMAHPILGLGAGARVSALAMRYSDWQSGNRVLTPTTAGAIPVELTYVGEKPLAALREALGRYLFKTTDPEVAPLPHDRRFDELSEDDFLDVTRVHDDLSLVREGLYRSAASDLGFTSGLSPASEALDTFSYTQARWLSAHVHALLLDAIFAAPGARSSAIRVDARDALERVKVGVRKIQRRMNSRATAASPIRSLRATTHAGETEVSPSDPNVSIHAALKNEALAEACGIVTAWRAVATQPINGDFVLLLDANALSTNPAAATVTTQPTAFRRIGHTHPLSFNDVGNATATTNAALAYLNDAHGNPRYRATAIKAETAIVQNTILQVNNSISNLSAPPATRPGNEFTDIRDDRPPQLLESEQFGLNEPETAGLTISAPTEDLLTPSPLKDPQRPNTLPCLFLEDLWVGYRFDLADEAGGGLLSIHRQTQEITFSATKVKVRGAMEDFFAREQPGDPSAGVTSTEIGRYQGLNTAQTIDYMKFLGTYREPAVGTDVPFTSKIVGYADATPLRFGRIYKYRLRNVFLGGLSLADRDPNLDRFGNSYVQACPFFRARAYRPGEVVSEDIASDDRPTGGGGRTIFLTASRPKASVWVVPTPVDIDTARYSGTFLTSTDEPERNSHRSFVKDISKYFKTPPTKLDYFFDPEVSEIVVRITMLNGDPDVLNRQFSYRDGAFCELSQHLRLPPEKARFGESGRWERFRPIQILFSTTMSMHPHVTTQPGLGGALNVHVQVPPAADLEVSMLPAVDKTKLLDTASHVASSAQLASRRRSGSPAEFFAPVPAIAETKLRVIHCLKRPALAPIVVNYPVQTAPQTKTGIVAQRPKFKEVAEVSGYVQVDAASTGQLRLEASWADIDDNPLHQRYVSNAGRAASKPHSVNFDRYQPPSAALVARQTAVAAASLFGPGSVNSSALLGLQCAENKVFLGASTPEGLPVQDNRPCVVNFADMRRKRASVVAVATSRYNDHFPKDAPARFEAKSDPFLVEVPASMRLSPPELSHVVPLSREISGGQAGKANLQRTYAMRLYVRRPFFLSGPGERLAIGCQVGRLPEAPSPSLNKFVTQWGEDPIERPKLDVTLRAPRASDFRIPDGLGDVHLDANLYPPGSLEGASPVIYRDSVMRADPKDDPSNLALSAVSFAVRWDEQTKLWYCDVQIGDSFVGWCGMALYRHQPHAHEMVQFSQTPAWVYGAVLHGEPVAWLKQNGKLRVTVGPVFDPYTDFVLDGSKFQHGVGEDLRRARTRVVALTKYVANGQVFFEGLVPSDAAEWTLVKTRFGGSIASINLTAG